MKLCRGVLLPGALDLASCNVNLAALADHKKTLSFLAESYKMGDSVSSF